MDTASSAAVYLLSHPVAASSRPEIPARRIHGLQGGGVNDIIGGAGADALYPRLGKTGRVGTLLTAANTGAGIWILASPVPASLTPYYVESSVLLRASIGVPAPGRARRTRASRKLDNFWHSPRSVAISHAGGSVTASGRR